MLHLFYPQPGGLFSVYCKDFTDSSSREFQQSQTKAASSLSESADRGRSFGETGTASVGGTHRISSSRVVGLTSTELESLNELIHIDHIYVKSQPRTIITHEPSSNKDAHNPEHYEALNIEEAEITVPQTGLAGDNSISMLTDSLSRNTEQSLVSFEDSEILKQTSENADNFLNATDTSDSVMGSLLSSDIASDIEASWSLNFLDSFDLDDSLKSPNSLTDIQESALIEEAERNLAFLQQSTQNDNIKPSKLSDMNASFLNEIEDFLNKRDISVEPTSPLSGSFGDSDFYSEATSEVLSPQGSDVSLLDDVSWQDSFTELFPSLQ